MEMIELKCINIEDIEYLIDRLDDDAFIYDLEEQAYIDGLILKLQVLLFNRYEECCLDKEKESLKKEIFIKVRKYLERSNNDEKNNLHRI